LQAYFTRETAVLIAKQKPGTPGFLEIISMEGKVRIASLPASNCSFAV
jgi:hypothetical protein